MNILLNGENRTVETVKLVQLLEDYLNGKPAKGIAVAVNFKIVPKQNWDSFELKENDKIEIVHAVQGG
jgi:sulfur carrier protein